MVAPAASYYFSMNPQDIHQKFVAAFNRGDLDAIVALYEPEASLAPQPGVIVTGHAAIGEAFQAFLAMKPQIQIDTVRVMHGAGGITLLHGRWTLKGTGPDGNPAVMEGTTAEVVRRQSDGSWLYAIDNPFGGM